MHDKKNVPQGLCIKICIHMHKICIKVHMQYGKKLMRNECIKYAYFYALNVPKLCIFEYAFLKMVLFFRQINA